MRVLARTGIGRSTEESTSIERQRELIESWANERNHEIVAWAEDLEVPESISPFDAPKLSPYLTDPLSCEWDILVAWKLDILACNSTSAHELFTWIFEQKKTLVCISENIDLKTWIGRTVASAIAGVDEGELETVWERAKSSKPRKRQTERWIGGKSPFGYVPVKHSNGWNLEVDVEENKVVQKIFEMAQDGLSTKAIAGWLNNEQIPTATESPWGKQTKGWQSETVRQLLRNKAYLGWTMYENSLLLDAVGKPVRNCPPTVTTETFDSVQELLNARSSKPKGGMKSPLLGILKCWECGENLHIKRQKMAGGKINTAYYCPGNCLPHAVSGEPAKKRVYELFEQELGEYEIKERRIIAGRDTARELAEANQAYEELSDYIATANDENVCKVLQQQRSRLEEQIKYLKSTPDKTIQEWVATGRRYIDEWNELDEVGRRLLMLRHEVIVRIRQLSKSSWQAPGELETEFRIPQQLRDRLKKK